MTRPMRLTPEDLRHFRDHGYVRVSGAFSPSDAASMQDAWWAELAAVHRIERNDRTTWRQPLADLKAAKRDPLQVRILTARVAGVLDDLLGEGAWDPPRDWGRTLVTFPEAGRWDVPSGLWHWDNPCGPEGRAPDSLFVVSFIGRVEPGGGGTLLIAGSHRLLARQEAALAGRRPPLAYRERRALFYGLHPWLAALCGEAASPPDRIGAFMRDGAEIGGVPVRVVELTGEPGDMVFCHPAIVHCAAPNRTSQPRFMRILQRLASRAAVS